MYLSKRTGFYLAVVEGGDIAAGDAIELLYSHPLRVTPRNIVDLYLGHTRDPELLERALSLEFVTDRMRKTFTDRVGIFVHGEKESDEF